MRGLQVGELSVILGSFVSTSKTNLSLINTELQSFATISISVKLRPRRIYPIFHSRTARNSSFLGEIFLQDNSVIRKPKNVFRIYNSLTFFLIHVFCRIYTIFFFFLTFFVGKYNDELWPPSFKHDSTIS